MRAHPYSPTGHVLYAYKLATGFPDRSDACPHPPCLFTKPLGFVLDHNHRKPPAATLYQVRQTRPQRSPEVFLLRRTHRTCPSSCHRLRVNVLVTLTPTPKRDGRPYYLIHKEYLREGGGVSTSSEQSALPPIGFPEPQTLNQHRRVFLFLLLPSPHDATTLF